MSSVNRFLYKLPQSVHAQIFEERIKPNIFRDVISVQSPIAIIFGGQPGAGKSALTFLGGGRVSCLCGEL